MLPQIQCPVCFCSLGPLDKKCLECGFFVETINNIIDLRHDKSIDTLLNVDAYDEQHNIRPANVSLAKAYFALMEQAGRAPGGDILEIACGSGHLTIPLILSEKFDSISISDISLNFMQMLEEKVSSLGATQEINKFLFDANAFPLQNQQFDFVIGNSVLHHFSKFENSLVESLRVLRPGGVAAFGEPIMDSHVFLSLAAGLILRNFKSSGINNLDKRTCNILEVIQGRSAKKMDQLHSDRCGLEHIEDKFQFPLDYLRNLSLELGFSRFVIPKAPPDLRLGDIVRRHLAKIISATGSSADFLDDFDYIFDAFNSDYSDPLNGYIQPMFSLFAFVK